MERFSLIRGCRYKLLNHGKTIVHHYVDFFIFVFLNSYSHASSFHISYNKWYQSFKLKISGITKDYKEHKMKIKGILVQGEVDCSLIKISWVIDFMEFDPRWRLLEYVTNS